MTYKHVQLNELVCLRRNVRTSLDEQKAYLTNMILSCFTISVKMMSHEGALKTSNSDYASGKKKSKHKVFS